MAGIPSMGFVNVRHKLTEIGIRQEHAKINSAPYTPAKITVDRKHPVNGQHNTQATIEIDQYESRKAVGGFLSPEDFAKKYGDQGLEHIAEVISKHVQEGWDAAKNAAKPGRVTTVDHAVADLTNRLVEWPKWDLAVVPPPEITVNPSRIEGDIDPGYTKLNIDATTEVNFDYSAGKAETYINDQGFIKMWMTKGYIDLEA